LGFHYRAAVVVRRERFDGKNHQRQERSERVIDLVVSVDRRVSEEDWYYSPFVPKVSALTLVAYFFYDRRDVQPKG
jgi:hypothetical protein